MGIQINGNTDTVTSTTAGGRVTVTPASFPSVNNINATGLSTFSGGLLVGTGASISSPTTNVLTLGTNNTEAIRIDSSGNVGLGTVSPGRKLHLYGNLVELLIEDPSNSINSNRLNLYLSGDKANFRMLNQAGTGGTVFLQGDAVGNITLPTANTSILNSSGRKILNQTGGVLQVVNTIKTNQFTTTSGTAVDVTGLSAAITPSSTSSKVLVIAWVVISTSGGGGDGYARLMRDSTSIGNGDDGYFGQSAGQDYFAGHSKPITYLDSPASNSSLTYKIQVWGANTSYVNGRGYDGSFRTSSGITLMEIAG
jgi:hypothetical protein